MNDTPISKHQHSSATYHDEFFWVLWYMDYDVATVEDDRIIEG